jgi:hypothetical protein
MSQEIVAGQERAFLAQLFDFSFTRFITTRIIKLLYGLGLFFGFAGTIVILVGAFGDSVTAGVVALALSPFWLLLYVIIIRVLLEMAMVIFRMTEHIGEIARQGRSEP